MMRHQLLACCDVAFEECESGYLQIKTRFNQRKLGVFTHEEFMEYMRSSRRIGLFDSRRNCIAINMGKQWDQVFGLEV